MFRTLTALWRRPAPPVREFPAADVSEYIDQVDTFSQTLAIATVPLPARTPGLSLARRHVYAGLRHGFAALRDVDAWHDTESAEEAHVREVAGIHQLDDALDELAAARATLTAITRKGR